MWKKIKSNERLYRSLRTFGQAFIGYIATAIVATTAGADFKTILTGALAPAIATAIAAVMNSNKKYEITESEE